MKVDLSADEGWKHCLICMEHFFQSGLNYKVAAALHVDGESDAKELADERMEPYHESGHTDD